MVVAFGFAGWFLPQAQTFFTIKKPIVLFFFKGGLSVSVLEVEEEGQLQSTSGDLKEGRGGQPGPAGAGRPLQTPQALHAPSTRPREGE